MVSSLFEDEESRQRFIGGRHCNRCCFSGSSETGFTGGIPMPWQQAFLALSITRYARVWVAEIGRA